jgi:hypothetical protein
MRTCQSVIAIVVFAQLLCASPSSMDSERSGDYAFEDRKIDPEAAARLRTSFAGQEGAKEVAAAQFKFLAHWEAGPGFYVFAADKVSFTREGIMCMPTAQIAPFRVEDGKEQLGSLMSCGGLVTLEFDISVRSMNDIPRAKLRFLRSGNLLINGARDKNLKPKTVRVQ